MSAEERDSMLGGVLHAAGEYCRRWPLLVSDMCSTACCLRLAGIRWRSRSHHHRTLGIISRQQSAAHELVHGSCVHDAAALAPEQVDADVVIPSICTAACGSRNVNASILGFDPPRQQRRRGDESRTLLPHRHPRGGGKFAFRKESARLPRQFAASRQHVTVRIGCSSCHRFHCGASSSSGTYVMPSRRGVLLDTPFGSGAFLRIRAAENDGRAARSLAP